MLAQTLTNIAGVIGIIVLLVYFSLQKNKDFIDFLLVVGGCALILFVMLNTVP